jgi:predicted RNA binding protein YcfA (HicA-like mRNA interferase family)
MSKRQKIIEKILAGRTVSYEEAENILLHHGFVVEVRGSHHTFRKDGFVKNISLKRRSQLLPYQLEMLKEVLKDHGY